MLHARRLKLGHPAPRPIKKLCGLVVRSALNCLSSIGYRKPWRFKLVTKVLDITVQETATMYVFQPVNDPEMSGENFQFFRKFGKTPTKWLVMLHGSNVFIEKMFCLSAKLIQDGLFLDIHARSHYEMLQTPWAPWLKKQSSVVSSIWKHLLPWKLTCPLKINGWKTYSLLK